MSRWSVTASALALSLLFSTAAEIQAAAARPKIPHAIQRTVSFPEMERFLAAVNGQSGITVSVEGKSVQSRSLYLVHATRTPNPPFRILFFAQQHGDEVSGKDALLLLVQEIAENPERLPTEVDLYIVPMLNPDGAEADTRRNAAGADLNRDHIALEQPETQALHNLVRRIRPHLAVDCHEFTRDADEPEGRNWTAWPDITLDGLNNPLFDPKLIAIAQRWIDESAAPLAAAGHPFYRYTVGGQPPAEEQRHSAPDVDSALNAVGMYGGLSFIIEAAVRRDSDAPPDDLARRVDAYLTLFHHFLKGGGHRAEDLAAVERARRRPLPPFLPTNYLWVNPGMAITEFPVTDRISGRTLMIPTANMMTTLAVKRSVSTPQGYAVTPEAAADFEQLLGRHGIPFEELKEPRPIEAQVCRLLRMEDRFDELYSRYEGRQIVDCAPAAAATLPPGALWIPLTGEAAVRAALVLEPLALYGVYQFPRFAKYATPGARLPVQRVVNARPTPDR